MCRSFGAAFEDALHREEDVRALLVALNPAKIEDAFAGIDLEGTLTLENAQEAIRWVCGQLVG
jgi:hypothetical protein